MKTIGIGIVGTGSRSTAFGGWLSKNGEKNGVRLVALHDINPVRLKAVQAQLGGKVPLYDNYGKFLNAPGMDGVIITTPCHTHAALTIQALDAGKHVLCEKAMAITAGDCAAMLEAERKSGKRLQVGLCLRYADFMRDLIPIIRRGEIGEVKLVSAVETLEGSSHFGRWHRLKKLSGGILLQKGTHTLDLINWIMGANPQVVSGFGGRDVYKARTECRGRRCKTCPEAGACAEFRDLCGNEKTDSLYGSEAEAADGYICDECVFDPVVDIMDNVTLSLSYEGGRRANYAISLYFERDGIEREFIIIGTAGKITVSRRREEIIILRRRSMDTIHYKLSGHGEGFNEQMRDFVNMVHTGKKPLADSQAGYWSALAGLAGETAVAENRVVELASL